MRRVVGSRVEELRVNSSGLGPGYVLLLQTAALERASSIVGRRG